MQEYKIIQSDDIERLTFRVTDYLHMGWEPTGGVVVDSMERCFYQAMVRK